MTNQQEQPPMPMPDTVQPPVKPVVSQKLNLRAINRSDPSNQPAESPGEGYIWKYSQTTGKWRRQKENPNRPTIETLNKAKQRKQELDTRYKTSIENEKRGIDEIAGFRGQLTKMNDDLKALQEQMQKYPQVTREAIHEETDKLQKEIVRAVSNRQMAVKSNMPWEQQQQVKRPNGPLSFLGFNE